MPRRDPSPTTVARLACALVVAALSGCASPPDATLPGVRTESKVEDRFTCGPLLFAAGCTLVHIESVDSGCAPEVPGYVVCDATVWWNASSGSVTPGARLVTAVNGTAGPTCAPTPGQPCVVRGNVTFRHAFTGPDEQAPWDLTFTARLDGAAGPAGGDFTLHLSMAMRTEPASATDA